MSMYGRDPWGGPLEICHDSATDDDRSRNLDLDRGALSRTLDETQQSWLLAGPGDQGRKKKKYVDLGCLVVSRKLFVWTVGVLLAAAVFAGLVAGIAKAIPRHHRPPPPPDDFTVALRKALMFFNAQKCECASLPAASRVGVSDHFFPFFVSSQLCWIRNGGFFLAIWAIYVRELLGFDYCAFELCQVLKIRFFFHASLGRIGKTGFSRCFSR